ncbi:MAG: DUF1330 domain-containing protein [Bradyrhizobium sp.]
MSDQKSASDGSAKTQVSLFQTSAIALLLVCNAYITPAMARGGHMHAFGVHEGHGMGGGLLTPAYVLITVSKITNPDAFKTAIQDLMADTSSGGRVTADEDKPMALEGTAPEHVVMIQFDNPDRAQAWKNSEAFKSFDEKLHHSSESTMQLVQGLPASAARSIAVGARKGRGFDQKAFEPNVKEYDQMLNKMHGICQGC